MIFDLLSANSTDLEHYPSLVLDSIYGRKDSGIPKTLAREPTKAIESAPLRLGSAACKWVHYAQEKLNPAR